MCVITDNASSNVTLTQNLATECVNFDRPFLQENWIRCFAHVINLAVQASLTQIHPLLEKVRREFILMLTKEFISFSQY